MNSQNQIPIIPNNFATNNSGGERQSRNRSHNRGNTNGRERSKSPHFKKIDFKDPKNKGKCKWHILYGENAYHCTLPCVDSNLPLKQKPSKDSSTANSTN